MNKIKNIMGRIILIIGIILFFSVMNQNLRVLIGQSVNIIMNPIINIIGKSNFYLVILLLSFITSLYSSIIQKYTLNQERIYNFQNKVKELQYQIENAKKNNNYAALKKLEYDQVIIMKEQTSIMKDQFKPMFYVIAFSIPLFMWIYYYISQNSGLYMCFPIWGDQLLSDSLFFTFQYWIYWYFIISLSSGQIIKKIIKNNK